MAPNLKRQKAAQKPRNLHPVAGNYSIWLIEDPDKTKLTVAYKGHSAISYLLAWKRASVELSEDQGRALRKGEAIGTGCQLTFTMFKTYVIELTIVSK